MSDENTRVVIDNGSITCKVGFAGDDAPRRVFPTIIGKPDGGKHSYVGDEGRKSALGFTRPIQHGIITDWDGMEKIWSHALFDELAIAPEEQGVLLTETPFNPKDAREKMIQVMFETFNFPSTYVASQPVLALYANGITTGLVLDCGGDVIHAVPIYEGYPLSHATKRFHFTGHDITDYLITLLNNGGYSFPTLGEREIVVDIKEKLGYVALDFDEEITKYTNDPTLGKSYTLPNGDVIEVGDNAFRCTEILFQPTLAGRKCFGLSRLANDSILQSDKCIRKDLYANIVLSGGTSLFPGLEDRIKKDILQLAPPSLEIKIHAPESRKYSTWIGGSILAGLHTYREMWISKAQYEEVGPEIVHRNCPL